MPLAMIAGTALLAAVGALAFARAILGRGRGASTAAMVEPSAEAHRVVMPPPSANDNLGRLYEAVERELRAGGYLR